MVAATPTETRPRRSIAVRNVDDPTIFVRADGDGFVVTVEPAPDGFTPPGPFVDHKRARGYAGGLRMIHCWKLIDETREGAR